MPLRELSSRLNRRYDQISPRGKAFRKKLAEKFWNGAVTGSHVMLEYQNDPCAALLPHIQGVDEPSAKKRVIPENKPSPEQLEKRSLVIPEYRNYLSTLGKISLVEVEIKEEIEPTVGSNPDGTLTVSLATDCSAVQLSDVTQKIRELTPKADLANNYSEEFSPYEQMERAMLEYGIATLPHLLGRNGWSRKAQIRQGLAPNETRSFNEIVESDENIADTVEEIIRLKEALSPRPYPGVVNDINDLELSYIHQIQEKVSKIPFESHDGSPYKAFNRQTISCVNASFMGVFLEKANIPYAVVSIPWHSMIIAQLANGDLHWFDFLDPTIDIKLSDTELQEQVPSAIADISSLISAQQDQKGIKVDVDMEVFRDATEHLPLPVYKDDPRSWIFISTPQRGHLVQMMQALTSNGNGHEALYAATLAEKLEPDLPNPHIQKASAYINIGNYYQALQAINTALEIDPYEHIAYQVRGVVNERAKDYDAAEIDYASALDLSIDFALAWNGLGYTKHMKGKLADELVCYYNAHYLSPDSELFKKKLEKTQKRYYANVLKNKGDMNFEREEYQSALRDFINALKVLDGVNDIALLTQLYSRLGNTFEKEGRTEEAVSAWLTLAQMQQQKRRFPEAIQSTKKALELQPNDPRNAFSLGVTIFEEGKEQQRQGKNDEAEHNFARAVTIFKSLANSNPDRTEPFYQLSSVAAWQGDFDKAKKYLQRAALKESQNLRRVKAY